MAIFRLSLHLHHSLYAWLDKLPPEASDESREAGLFQPDSARGELSGPRSGLAGFPGQHKPGPTQPAELRIRLLWLPKSFFHPGQNEKKLS
jgi:hypothetical protein